MQEHRYDVGAGGAGMRAAIETGPPEAATAKERTRSLYRGDPGMWSWVLHRITGVATFFFLFVHVLDTALVRVNPDTYDRVIETYKNPLVGLMELALVAMVLYHALNGLRVMLVDFWSKGPQYQRVMLWVILAICFVVMIPAAGRIFYNMFAGH